MTEGDGESAVRNASNYWDTLAPHHWRLENNYLNVSSVRLILGDIRQPVLVVGAGQGLIVEQRLRRVLQIQCGAEALLDLAWTPAGSHVAHAVGIGAESPRLRCAGGVGGEDGQDQHAPSRPVVHQHGP